MTAKVLMVQGTSSSVGKSLLVTALCHSYARRGVRVAPFKAQNMSNNAAVCPDGAEIGRAQAVQAWAAGILPAAEMNPILLKPEADSRSQVVVMGRPWQSVSARSYYQHKQALWQVVTRALDHLRETYDLVLVEGAGSPVELNLKLGDMVNMAVARYARAPILLVGDIDRGGIFAQLLGTLWLLPLEERELVRALVVNKFRGDLSLFAEGVHILEEKSGLPVLGVIPHLKDLLIPEEDAVALENRQAGARDDSAQVDLAVIQLPMISNFDDFDPLKAEPGVQVRFVDFPEKLGRPHAILLPGTKSTVADLEWLRRQGLEQAVLEHARRGGAVAGICGGYQMLGQVIQDPGHVEAPVDRTPGLGLLPVSTRFQPGKATHLVRARVLAAPGWLSALQGQEVEGYEIHMGTTQTGTAWLEITSRNGEPVAVPDGAVGGGGRIWGCYLHGLFTNQRLRRAWLASLGWQEHTKERTGVDNLFSTALARLADSVEAALDIDRLEVIVWGD